MDKSWTFIYAADMQLGSPKSFRYKPAFAENWQTARRQIIDRKPEFLLIGGDATLGFLEYTVSGKQIEKTFIPLEKVSTRTDGYGQGGHPRAETRDYSLAWEK